MATMQPVTTYEYIELGVVNLYGTEIEVGNGDTWTVEERIVDVYAELNDRYTKKT